MMHTFKSIRVFAIVEQVIEPPVNLEELRRELKAGKFRGEVHVNSNQGGVTNVVTRERIELTMQELDGVLARR
jgi:hypothetical protein